MHWPPTKFFFDNKVEEETNFKFRLAVGNSTWAMGHEMRPNNCYLKCRPSIMLILNFWIRDILMNCTTQTKTEEDDEYMHRR